MRFVALLRNAEVEEKKDAIGDPGLGVVET